jgi:hypothetical protein
MTLHRDDLAHRLPSTLESPMIETNVEIARRGYEAAARGELDVIAR